MSEQSQNPDKPMHPIWMMLVGAIVGLTVGLALGLVTWNIGFASNDFLRWLHPEISGGTGYFLGIFAFDVMVLPFALVLLGGIVLPIGYAVARHGRKPTMNIRRWLLWMLALFSAFTVLSFLGAPKWPVLVAIQLVPALAGSAAVTTLMLYLFREQLAKLSPLTQQY